jgi:SAM-dependent methyltransferase
MTSADPSKLVEESYDALDRVYREWVATTRGGPRAAFREEVLRLIPPGASVLEIGCGPGTDARALAEGRRYTGIDLSSVQLAHARRAVPDGTFLHQDILDSRLPTASFDAVVALYSLVHIPAARTSELFERMATWLRPDGLFCATFGTSDNPGAVQRGWLGAADMYFSSLPPERTAAALRDAGFSIVSADAVTEVEAGEGPATFLWVIARRATGEPR